jgi:nitroreductase
VKNPAPADYPIDRLIEQRWSPRAFDPRPIPREDLRSVLEAAGWAASAFNEQPWRFIVAPREETAEFATMLGCLVEGNQSWARNAGALMLTAVAGDFKRNGKPNRCALHDLGQAAANLALQATSLGLFVHQMAGVQLDRVRETYSIPTTFDPQTAIAIGYPGSVDTLPENLREGETAPRVRNPQSEFVFAGTWGQAADW